MKEGGKNKALRGMNGLYLCSSMKWNENESTKTPVRWDDKFRACLGTKCTNKKNLGVRNFSWNTGHAGENLVFKWN